MKGTILDFLKLASEDPDLAKELIELAARHDFQFGDELTDAELEAVAGGGMEIPTDRPLTDEERYQLQKEQQEQATIYQVMGGIMQSWHDQAKAIISNMK